MQNASTTVSANLTGKEHPPSEIDGGKENSARSWNAEDFELKALDLTKNEPVETETTARQKEAKSDGNHDDDWLRPVQTDDHAGEKLEKNAGTASGRQYLYIIRHGDRWDAENPGWGRTASRPLDTPLSQLGHNQARETGLFLDECFQRDGIASADDITWLSSPFLRCLQTSDEALNALALLPNAREIRIKPEYCVSEWGDRRSLPSPEERQIYFPRLEASYESMFYPNAKGETPRVFWEQRCARAAASITKYLPYRPNTAIVVVSHAAPCIGIAEAAAGLTWADVNPAAPCGVYRLHRTSARQDLWTMDMNGHTDHLSDSSGNTGAYHPEKKKKKKRDASSGRV